MSIAEYPQVDYPAVPDKLTIQLWDNEKVIGEATSSAELKRFLRNEYPRIEVHFPLWIGYCAGETARVGNEIHPDDYVNNCVSVVKMCRRHLAPLGTIWTWLVDTTIDNAANMQPPPEVIAELIEQPHTEHGGKGYFDQSINPKTRIMGVLGERAFARMFGGRVYFSDQALNDCGDDFITRAGTVNVKTRPADAERFPDLLLRVGRKHDSAIHVLARLIGDDEDATLVGWQYTRDIIENNRIVEPPPHRQPAYAAAPGVEMKNGKPELRPIRELLDLCGITHKQGVPMRLDKQVMDGLQAIGLRRWGTNIQDNRPHALATPRVYVWD